MTRVRNLGKRSFEEIVEKFKTLGLSLKALRVKYKTYIRKNVAIESVEQIK